MQKEQRTNPILHFTSVLNYFHEKVVFFVMSWCTSGVGLQVLPFIDNRHLGSNFLPAISLYRIVFVMGLVWRFAVGSTVYESVKPE